MLIHRLLILALLVAASPVAALEVGAPVLETITLTGQPAVICSGPALSDTGRYLTFNCLDSNIVPGDNNERYDVFLRDRVTSTVQRVSVDSNGVEQRFDSCCYTPAVDGRVAFQSSGSFVPDVQPPPSGVGPLYNYLRDTNSATTILISRRLDGIPTSNILVSPPGHVSLPAKLVALLSDTDLITGQFVFFSSKGFIRNWETGAVEYIATSANGDPPNAGAGPVALSSNGRYVVFGSSATNLGSQNPSGEFQLFLRDRVTNSVKRLTYPVGGSFAQPLDVSGAMFTENDQSLLFNSSNKEFATNGNLLPLVSVFLMNLATTETVAVSTGNHGQIPDNQSSRGVISGDGRYLAFFSRATNLLDTPQTPNVYVKDRWTGELRNVSASLGELRQFDRPGVTISADGSVVSFSWRYADTVPTLGGRTLIYSVAVRGAPANVPPLPVPTGNLWILLVMAIAVGVAGVAVGSRVGQGAGPNA